MTSDGDALLAAVLANRDDDTPRLVYADWLDENGEEEHAGLIRSQIELANFAKTPEADVPKQHGRYKGRCSPKCRRCEFWGRLNDANRREVEFMEAFCRRRFGGECHITDAVTLLAVGNRIVKPSRGVAADGHGVTLEFDRGFVWKMVLSAEDWHQGNGYWRSRHLVREVELTSLPTVDAHQMTDGRVYSLSWFHPRVWYATSQLRNHFESRGYFARRDQIPGDPVSELAAVAVALCEMRWPGIEFRLRATHSAGMRRRFDGVSNDVGDAANWSGGLAPRLTPASPGSS